MDVTITIPPAKVQGVVDAFCYFGNYRNYIPNPAFNPDLPEDPVTNPLTLPNPETANQFAIRMLKEDIKKVYLRHQRILAKEASDTAIDVDYNSFDIT